MQLDTNSIYEQSFFETSRFEKGRCGIYCVLNKINGKIYIGSSSDIRRRHNVHKTKLNCNVHCNKHLQNSVNKYGINNFKFLVIESCEKDDLIKREQYWLDYTKCYDNKIGYNIRTIADSNTNCKRPMSEETKEKMRIIGRDRGSTKEFKEFISSLHKGKVASEETKLKSSISHKGQVVSKETRKKMSEANSKKIINLDTGDIYNNMKECVKELKISKATAYNWMNKKYRAKVNLELL